MAAAQLKCADSAPTLVGGLWLVLQGLVCPAGLCCRTTCVLAEGCRMLQHPTRLHQASHKCWFVVTKGVARVLLKRLRSFTQKHKQTRHDTPLVNSHSRVVLVCSLACSCVCSRHPSHAPHAHGPLSHSYTIQRKPGAFAGNSLCMGCGVGYAPVFACMCLCISVSAVCPGWSRQHASTTT